MHSEPKWFTHAGHFNTDPTKVKKNGAGAHNWGQIGDELDTAEYSFAGQSQRRNSNHLMNVMHMEEMDEKCERRLQS